MIKAICKILQSLLFISLSFYLTGCEIPGSKIKDQQLVLGLQAGYPPYESVDKEGNVVGFDVDVANQLATLMNKKLVIKQMGFDALILSLKNGKIDLIISGMSITEERQKEITMIPYIGDKLTSLELLFWEQPGSPIEALNGKSVAVQSGTFQENILKDYPQIMSKSLENIQELVMDVKYGKSSAILVEPAVATYLKEMYPQLTSVALQLPTEKQPLGNGIGIAKKNEQLAHQVETLIHQLKEDGTLKNLEEKWFHD